MAWAKYRSTLEKKMLPMLDNSKDYRKSVERILTRRPCGSHEGDAPILGNVSNAVKAFMENPGHPDFRHAQDLLFDCLASTPKGRKALRNAARPASSTSQPATCPRKPLIRFATESVVGKRAIPVQLSSNSESRCVYNIISKPVLADRIHAFACRVLDSICRNEDVTFVPILNGAMRFYSEVAQYTYQGSTEELMPVQARSYGKGRIGGNLTICRDMIIPEKIRGRTVVLLDDILDSGKTVEAVADLIQEHKPKQIITVFLLRKKNAQITSIVPDYVLFDVHPRSWVFGFGMDLEEKYRRLSYICDDSQDLYNIDGVPLY